MKKENEKEKKPVDKNNQPELPKDFLIVTNPATGQWGKKDKA